LKLNKKNAGKQLFDFYMKHGIDSDDAFVKFVEKIHGKIDYKILAAGVNAYDASKVVKPYPNVKKTLKKLKKKGLKLGVVTDAPRLKAYQRLNLMGMDNLFLLESPQCFFLFFRVKRRNRRQRKLGIRNKLNGGISLPQHLLDDGETLIPSEPPIPHLTDRFALQGSQAGRHRDHLNNRLAQRAHHLVRLIFNSHRRNHVQPPFFKKSVQNLSNKFVIKGKHTEYLDNVQSLPY